MMIDADRVASVVEPGLGAALRARARRVRGAVWCLACAARACVRACDGL
jgi:hypothetical protein